MLKPSRKKASPAGGNSILRRVNMRDSRVNGRVEEDDDDADAWIADFADF